MNAQNLPDAHGSAVTGLPGLIKQLNHEVLADALKGPLQPYLVGFRLKGRLFGYGLALELLDELFVVVGTIAFKRKKVFCGRSFVAVLGLLCFQDYRVSSRGCL
jgi:hypothetical protein